MMSKHDTIVSNDAGALELRGCDSKPRLCQQTLKKKNNEAKTKLQAQFKLRGSDVPARLGPKATALAWPEPALAFSRAGLSQSCHSRLGPGPVQPKPWLLAHILIKFIYNANRHGKNNE